MSNEHTGEETRSRSPRRGRRLRQRLSVALLQCQKAMGKQEWLLRALLLQVLYTFRSERLLILALISRPEVGAFGTG